jgi:hypothetical protein
VALANGQYLRWLLKKYALGSGEKNKLGSE